MKKIIVMVLAIITALTICGCGKSSGGGEYTCTISISCAVLNEEENYNKLPTEKQALVPQNGWVLEPTEVPFSEGESAFDVLKRATQDKKIHLEFSETPAYNSAYIEGINNIYEFDCGDLSGWMFSVNGEFPNYGSSTYKLQDGDEVCWVYTCDLGADVGNKVD